MNLICIICVMCSSVFMLSEAAYYPSRSGNCAPLQLENGRVRMRLRARIVRFVCLTGYEIVGNKYATCNDKEWDVPAPVCVKTGCKSLPSIRNGFTMQSHRNSYALFFCAPGYQLSGSPALYCNGIRWNASLPVCVGTADQPSLSCDFERDDLCGWKNDEFHDFDWRRLSKLTPSAFMNTGPSYDHTLGPGGSGHYLYVESTGRSEYDRARLVSPIFSSELAGRSCFSFYYHMFGKTTGSLRVYVKPVSMDLIQMVNDADTIYKLFDKSGNQGDFWFREIFDMPQMKEDFQIVVEGVRGASFTSDIAVDDVALLTSTEECRQARESIQPVVLPPLNRTLLDSCNNRCNSTQLFTDRGYMYECSCQDTCISESSCCADYHDICDVFPDDTTSTATENTDRTTNSDSEPAPQTMKLVASSQTLMYSTKSVRSTPSKPFSTTTVKPTTASKPSSPATVPGNTTVRSATIPESQTKTLPSTTKRNEATMTQTTKARTTTIRWAPTLIFKTPTPEPTNATGLLNKVNTSKDNETIKTKVETSTMITSPKVTATGAPVRSVTQTIAMLKTTAVPIKLTTKYDGVVPISRTFENHNTYHELVRKAKQDTLKGEEHGGGARLAAGAAAAAAACLLLALAVLAVRGGWVRRGVEWTRARARARGHEATDEVRYLTNHDQLDFD